MSFGQAVKSVLSQYATFTGRARRSEYWWYSLFHFVLMLPGQILYFVGYFSVFGSVLTETDPNGELPSDAFADANWAPLIAGSVLMLIVGLALFLPGLAVTVRRLHDTGRTGHWYWISLVPFGGFVLLAFAVMDGQPHPNEWGPDPKAAQRPQGLPYGYPTAQPVPYGYAQAPQAGAGAPAGYPGAPVPPAPPAAPSLPELPTPPAPPQ